MTIIGIYYALPFEEIIQKPEVYALVAEGMMQGNEVILLNDTSFTRNGRVSGYIRLNGKWVLRKKDYPNYILNYSEGLKKPKCVYPTKQTSTTILKLIGEQGAVWPNQVINQDEVIQALASHTLLLKTSCPHEDETIVIQKKEDKYLLNSAEGDNVISQEEMIPLLQLAKDNDYFIQQIPGTVVPTLFHVSLIKQVTEWKVVSDYSYRINDEMRVEARSVLEQINAEKSDFLHYYLLQLAKDTAKKLEERLEQPLIEIAFSFLLDSTYKFWIIDSKLSTVYQADAVEYAKQCIALLNMERK